jgi:hypothetical protein
MTLSSPISSYRWWHNQGLSVQQAEQLRPVLVDYISPVDWDIAGSLTFRYKHLNYDLCFKIFREFLFTWETEDVRSKEIAKDWQSPRGESFRKWVNSRKKDRANSKPIWIMAVEPHKSGRLHLHFLLKSSPFIGLMDESLGKQIWQAPRGRECRIETPRSQRACVRYIVKCIMNGMQYDLSSNFPQ